MGDLNFHLDIPEHRESARLLDILDIYGFQQHVREATHQSGHTLDVVITTVDGPDIDIEVGHLISDYHLLICSLGPGSMVIYQLTCSIMTSRRPRMGNYHLSVSMWHSVSTVKSLNHYLTDTHHQGKNCDHSSSV